MSTPIIEYCLLCLNDHSLECNLKNKKGCLKNERVTMEKYEG